MSTAADVLLRSAGRRDLAPTQRWTAIAAVIALHIGLYYLVNWVNGGRPAADLLDFRLPVDDWIPFLPSTAIVYYLGDAYIILWGGYILGRLPPDGFRRAIAVYAAMIAVGAAVQLTLPARAPWPADPASMQGWVHDAIALRAYACLPSMHVALSVLPAALSMSVLSRPTARVASVAAAALITVSTLTLKEHYFLDAVTGTLLGLVAWAVWRATARADRAGPELSPRQENG